MDKQPQKKAKTSLWASLLLLLSVIGPGLITANIDNDAGGIATYSMAGAHTGYRLLWILFPITVALIIVQEMAARMGIASGKGLADLIREKFGLKITFYILLFLIFADLGNTMAEFAGIAAAGEIFGMTEMPNGEIVCGYMGPSFAPMPPLVMEDILNVDLDNLDDALCQLSPALTANYSLAQPEIASAIFDQSIELKEELVKHEVILDQ